MTIYETYNYFYTGKAVHIPCNPAVAEYNHMVWKPIGLLLRSNFAISEKFEQTGYMTRIPKVSR